MADGIRVEEVLPARSLGVLIGVDPMENLIGIPVLPRRGDRTVTGWSAPSGSD